MANKWWVPLNALSCLVLLVGTVLTFSAVFLGVKELKVAGARNPAMAAYTHDLERIYAAFKIISLEGDKQYLSSTELEVLRQFAPVTAAIDAIFMKQGWIGTGTVVANIDQAMQHSHSVSVQGSPDGILREEYDLLLMEQKLVNLNYGPWDRLEGDNMFLWSAHADDWGVPVDKPPGAGFYPMDMTAEEWDEGATIHTWTDPTHVLHRTVDGIEAVPYNVAFRPELRRAATALLETAAVNGISPSLSAFLTERAHAFESNEYTASDELWLSTEGNLTVVVGPYSVHEDVLRHLKASFACIVGRVVSDEQLQHNVSIIYSYLQEAEDNLPVDEKYRSGERLSKNVAFQILDVVALAGDVRAGLTRDFFSFPANPAVRQSLGTRHLLLRNIALLQFEHIVAPIGQVAIPEQDEWNPDVYLLLELCSSLMHGLGPHRVQLVAGASMSSEKALGFYYPYIEEVKVQTGGIWLMEHLIALGALPSAYAEPAYYVFLATLVGRVRYGSNDLHGLGARIVLAHLMDGEAILFGSNNEMRINNAKFKEALTACLTMSLNTLASGDTNSAAKSYEDGSSPLPDMLTAIIAEANKNAIPMDIHVGAFH